MGIVIVDPLKSVKVEHVGNDRFLPPFLESLKFPVELESVINARKLVDINAFILQRTDDADKRYCNAYRHQRDSVNHGLNNKT